MMIATLGGLTFRGDGAPATYTLAKIPGWWGGAAMRHESTPRPNGHGDFDAPAFLSGRLITLQGLVLASSPVAFENALAALENVLADGSKGTLTVTQAGGTYTIPVRRHGELDLDVLVYGQSARYQMQLWAPNPEKVAA